jgi:hypothetical protein
VLPAEHLLHFAGVDLRLERIEGPGQIPGDVLTGVGPLDQNTKIVDAPAQ